MAFASVRRHPSRTRRLALFTAANLDGAASVSVLRGGDPWAFDGRIPEEAQGGDALYADNDFSPAGGRRADPYATIMSRATPTR